jgi:hypothetical protein
LYGAYLADAGDEQGSDQFLRQILEGDLDNSEDYLLQVAYLMRSKFEMNRGISLDLEAQSEAVCDEHGVRSFARDRAGLFFADIQSRDVSINY